MSQTNKRDSFHQQTIDYMKQTALSSRKDLGQFFTPKSIRQRLLNKLPELNQPAVLDPAAGTGEFLLDVNNYFNNPRLTGWEVDDQLVDIGRSVVPGATFQQKNPFIPSSSQGMTWSLAPPPTSNFSRTRPFATVTTT